MSNHSLALEGGAGGNETVQPLDDKWPARLREILDCLEDDLQRDHSPEQARALARRCLMTVADNFGGHPAYLPRGDLLRAAWRNESLYARFDGTNYYQLADEARLSESQVRKIIEILRKLDFAKRQKALPL